MVDGNEPKAPLLARLGKWLRLQVVREVPEDIATCEFDCTKPECTQGEWESCPRRLARTILERDEAKASPAEIDATRKPKT
jgi:hypothetical protein